MHCLNYGVCERVSFPCKVVSPGESILGFDYHYREFAGKLYPLFGIERPCVECLGSGRNVQGDLTGKFPRPSQACVLDFSMSGYPRVSPASETASAEFEDRGMDSAVDTPRECRCCFCRYLSWITRIVLQFGCTSTFFRVIRPSRANPMPASAISSSTSVLTCSISTVSMSHCLASFRMALGLVKEPST
jgi:hypothetical protein